MKKIIISFMIVFSAVSLHGAIVDHHSAEITVALLIACVLCLLLSRVYDYQELAANAKRSLNESKIARLKEELENSKATEQMWINVFKEVSIHLDEYLKKK